MPVTRSTDAPTWDVPGTRFIGLASPRRGGSVETALWRIVMTAGTPATRHSVTRTEVFTVVAGCASAALEGEEYVLGVGDTLVVPPDTQFELGNPGTEPFEAIVAFPAGGRAAMPQGNPFTPPWSE